jgi:hypothetical protein
MVASRIKLPFKLGDSKKMNEIEINETLKKEDFSISEVSSDPFFNVCRNNLIKY